MTTPKTSAVDWFLRSRETGRITIAQTPNVPLVIGISATALRWVVQPSGEWRTTLDVVGGLALVVWAADEILRGVNPWRRVLGGGVLLAVAASWWARR